ncbi:hypothetical protein PRIPAC_93492 [Pristionchus pacificus]|uniref:Uncharacterized protein n=1 Tax=Pristionchus pacificus TaxID=54126 RepID=A0A2A6C978_PRIPA|nr:hypothetical protein PRIPAC_93492 [Pristionchus pacificus]|eukprot:PDM74762.1 hypothetical protein PRIPAC_43713 [Pristionchus pacificus]
MDLLDSGLTVACFRQACRLFSELEMLRMANSLARAASKFNLKAVHFSPRFQLSEQESKAVKRRL